MIWLLKQGKFNPGILQTDKYARERTHKKVMLWIQGNDDGLDERKGFKGMKISGCQKIVYKK